MTVDERSPRKILIVDDFRDMVLALRIFLEGKGYEVLEAYDGVQALEILETQTPHMIILDIMMPRMDGWATLTRIQANERLQDIPVLMLTALNDPVNVKTGFDIGCTWYYTKPITDYPDFALVIERIIDECSASETQAGD